VKRLNYILFFILIFENSTFAQKQQKIIFDDFGNQCELNFFGNLYDSILPKNGAYELRCSKKTDTTFKTFVVKGKTKNHKPHGLWTWEEADWTYSIEASSSIRPNFKAFGIHSVWKGNFIEGEAYGNWTLKSDTLFDNGKSSKPHLEISFNFEKNKVVGDFKILSIINNQSYMLKGKTDKNGTVEGLWKLNYTMGGNQILEEFNYKNGLVIDVKTIDKSKTNKLLFQENIDLLSSNLKNKEQKIGDSTFYKNEFQSFSTDLYDLILQDFFEKGWKHEYFKFNLDITKPIFLRIEYPLSLEEKENLSRSKHLIEKQKKELEIYTSKNTSLYKNYSKELDESFLHLETMNLQLELIDSLLKRCDLPYFTYKKRFKNELKNWATTINQPIQKLSDSILSQKPHSIDTTVFKNDGVFVAIHKLLAQNDSLIPTYIKIIENSELSMKREGNLKQMEFEITQKIDSLHTLYVAQNKITKQLKEKWIKDRITNEIHKFTLTKDYELATKLGKKIISDMDTLISWSQRANDFDSLSHWLKSHYSFMAFNPYSGLYDINVPIKNRFITNILTNLWPFLENELLQEQDWEHWKALWNQHFELYYFLNEFVNKEDKRSMKLNKKVRKERNPQRILKLLMNHIHEIEH
jgi:hypothetical protein